jgi:hypothetical protein
MTDNVQSRALAFLYDAFISYRHVERDRKWAEWLIQALEDYRVPRALQEKGLPSKLKIFRDEDEMPASSDLSDQIKSALKASRFLIIVCSPYTPRSRWVEREIEIFHELGREDEVLALLTEGEPGDSFPSAVLERHLRGVDAEGRGQTIKEEKQPLAADVRPRKGVSNAVLKRIALLRLVAPSSSLLKNPSPRRECRDSVFLSRIGGGWHAGRICRSGWAVFVHRAGGAGAGEPSAEEDPGTCARCAGWAEP